MGRVGEYWSIGEENQLAVLWSKGYSQKDIAERLERTVGGIKSRLEKLGYNADRDVKPGCSLRQEDPLGKATSDYNPCVEITIPNQTIKMETTMKDRTVKTITYVGTTKASDLEVDDLLSVIEQEADFLKRLGSLAGSAGVLRLIEKHTDNLVALEALLEDIV